MEYTMKKRLLLLVVTVMLCASLIAAAPLAMAVSPDSLREVQVSGTYYQNDARGMLEAINAFRASKSQAWYWNEDDASKTEYNTTELNGLGALSYDYALEQIAMERARELSILFAHERPNGEAPLSATYSGVSSSAENIASGQATADAALLAWREDDAAYAGQGHRRNLLSADYAVIGIACFEVGSTKYWVQEFGPASSGAADPGAVNGPVSETVIVSTEVVDGYNDAPRPGTGVTGLAITAEFFPDANFRQYVLDNFDTETEDTPGYLSQAELDAVKSIDLMGISVGSLQGVEYFTQLTTLKVDTGTIAAVDLSKNTKLTTLSIQNVGLTSLDVSVNTQLKVLDCRGNALTSLSLLTNTQLQELYCSDNPITELDLRQNTALTVLNCSNTGLTALNVTANTKLLVLNCSGVSGLTELDVSKCKSLKALTTTGTSVAELNIKTNATLLELVKGTSMTTDGTVVSYIANEDASQGERGHIRLVYDSAVTNLVTGINTGATYTITLNENGGSWSSGTAPSYEVIEGNSFRGNTAIPDPADPHMFFTGWYAEPACTTLVVAESGRFVPKKDMTLYAGWEARHIVTFKVSGGKLTDYPNETEHSVLIAKTKAIGSGNIPAVTGLSDDHVLNYWEVGTEKLTAKQLAAYIPTGDITITATFREVWRLTLDANGGYFGDNNYPASKVVMVTKGEDFLCEENVPLIKDSRVAFSGWYADKDCTELVVGRSESFTPTEHKTLYARWTVGWDVTFDAGDGYFDDPSVTKITQTFPQGDAIASWPVPTSNTAGRSFAYWTLKDNTIISDPSKYYPTKDVTLYANYSKSNIVTLNANGKGYFGSDTGMTTMTVDVLEGESIRPADYVPNALTAGDAFDGWYLDAACTTPVSESYKPTGAVTLYAGWTDGWTITLQAGDGYFNDDPAVTVIELNVPKGSRIGTVPIPTSSEEGKGFSHWTQGTTVINNLSTLTPTGNMTLKANYVKQYTISLHANGGQFTNYTSATWPVAVHAGDSFYSFRYTPVHTDTRMAFTGWYSDKACKTLVLAPGETMTPSKDMDLYAGWKAGYTVTFKGNGGKINGSDEDLVVTVPKGESVQRNPYVSGTYTLRFNGLWYTSADCSGTGYNAYDYVPSKDITLYAGMKQLHTATLKATDGYFGGDPSKKTTTVKGIGDEILTLETPEHADPAIEFSGWYLDENLTKPADMYSQNQFLMLDKDVTLYAKWDDATLITFDPGATGRILLGGLSDGDKYTVTVTRNGLFQDIPKAESSDPSVLFAGQWMQYGGTGHGTVYKLGDAIPATEDITLRAVYKDPLTVKFVTTGWTEIYQIPDESSLGDLALSEKVLNSDWYTDANHTDRIFNFTTVVPQKAVNTYYGIDQSCQVTVISSSGTEIRNMKKGTRLFQDDTGSAAQYIGIYFLDAGYTVAIDPVTYIVTEDVTIYKRDSQGKVTISIELDGGSYTPNSSITDVVKVKLEKGQTGASALEAFNTENYLKSKQMCVGFSTTKGGAVDVDPETAVFYVDTTLYPVWKDCYFLILNFNGKKVPTTIQGKPALVGSLDKVYPSGSRINDLLPDAREYQTADGENGPLIEGWYLDAKCTKAIPQEATLSANTSIYAKWCANPIYITIEDNASGRLFETTRIRAVPGETFDLFEQVGKPSDLSVILSGFSLDAEGKNAVNGKSFQSTQNVTVYAQWEEGLTVYLSGSGRFFADNGELSHMIQIKAGDAIGAAYNNLRDQQGNAVESWYYDAELSWEATNTLANFKPTKSLTLYAKWPGSAPAVIQGCSLYTRGNVGLNFYLTLPDEFLTNNGATVQINGAAIAIPQPETNGFYKFTYYVTAKQMRDEVVLQLFDGKGTPYPLRHKSGADYTSGYSYSAQKYFDTVHAESTDAELLTLIDRMSDYGHYAQLHFKYNEANALNTQAMRDELDTVTLQTLRNFKDSVTEATNSGVAYQGATLLLKSETSLRHYFSLKSGKITDYKFYVDGVEVTPVLSGSSYIVEIPNISASLLSKAYSVQVKKGTQTLISIENYSALSYVRRVIDVQGNGDQTIVNLVRALYNYNRAALIYFG